MTTAAVTGEARKVREPQIPVTGPLRAVEATGRTVTAMSDPEGAPFTRDAVKAYTRGDSLATITAATGRSAPTAGRYLILAGVTRGDTMKAIAADTGWSTSSTELSWTRA